MTRKNSWKILKSIIGKSSCNSKRKLKLTINNEIVNDSRTIANEFNNFFVSIGPALADTITCSVDPMSYVDNIMNSMVISYVSYMDIKNTILSLKNSSPGYDELSAYIAKQCIDNYVMPRTYIINMSLMEGIFPSELKLAKVVPIFKSGESDKVTNHRPISVLSFFSKIFEKIMYNYVINFMDKNNTTYKYQFGFRKNHSTQHAIITLVDKITSSLDSGDIIIGVFLDLKKAFDTVNHQILFKKLFSYGIRGTILKWFKSYLTDRLQFVTIDGTQSEIKSVKCGVPQGSILGPLLFIIYMNDLYNVSEFLFTILYADDTCVLLHGKNLNDLIISINKELALLFTWLQANKLSLNGQKTYYMIFHRARIKLINNSSNVVIGGSILTKIDEIKYLGVIIDNKLTWIPHITYVKNKVSKGTGIMFKAKKILKRNTLINLYHSYIYPYLIYCIEAWGNASNCHLEQLYLTHKKFARMISFSNYNAHSIDSFKQLNILPLNKLVINRIEIMMYKYANNLLPPVINDMYTTNSDIHNYSTRQKHLLHVNKSNINIYSKSFANTSARIWNAMQSEIEVNVSISKFKMSLKMYLQEHTLHSKYSK